MSIVESLVSYDGLGAGKFGLDICSSPARSYFAHAFETLERRMLILRNLRTSICPRLPQSAYAAMTNDKLEIWKDLGFNVLFKGDDWRGTEKGNKLERDFAAVGVEVVYFPYTLSTSSSVLRKTLQNIDAMAGRGPLPTNPDEVEVDTPGSIFDLTS
jgi:hypothetical protein